MYSVIIMYNNLSNISILIKIIRAKFDIYVFITINGSIPLQVDY